jgi:hypothetical protein
MANRIPVAFAVTYLVGMTGAAWVLSQLAPKLMRVNLAEEFRKAFRVVAEQCNYDFGLLTEVMRINVEQRSRFLRKVRNALWTLRGKRLRVLGLAFKLYDPDHLIGTRDDPQGRGTPPINGDAM